MELPKYFYIRVRPKNMGTAVDLEDASDADVVEVVRCKDCKWHRTCEFYYALGNDRVPYETISECLKWHDDVPVDFYCAFGERREDGKV